AIDDLGRIAHAAQFAAAADVERSALLDLEHAPEVDHAVMVPVRRALDRERLTGAERNLGFRGRPNVHVTARGRMTYTRQSTHIPVECAVDRQTSLVYNRALRCERQAIGQVGVADQ